MTPIVIDEINLLRQLLPQARLLHIAAGLVSLCSNELLDNQINVSNTTTTVNDRANTVDNKAVTMYSTKPNDNGESNDYYDHYHYRNSDESYGAIVVGGMHPELSLLTSHELSKFELYAPVAICSSSHLSEHLMRNDVDGAMSILRALHSAQMPSVILSQWCTPDMKPSELLTIFYKLLFNAIHALHQNNNQTKYIDRDYLLSTNFQLNRDAVDNDDNNNDYNNLTRNYYNNTHQAIPIAVLLAHAIRFMLHNSAKAAASNSPSAVAEVDLRYCPRKWAAYYCFGCGASDLV